MRILIAEDDFTSRQVLQRYLAQFGDCDIAKDGQEAVRAFQEALERDEPYDLVCLDLLMPKMDGQRALVAIRQAEATHRGHGGECAKILVASALGDAASMEQAYTSRCDGYLTKPFSRSQIESQLRGFGLV